MIFTLSRWLQISFFNLLLVALLGVIMRYKIAYSLPFIDQKNFLHGHSHFAFSGWITQALMCLLVHYLYKMGNTVAFARYRILLYANLITAYGMLITFPVQGYAFLSISFSTLSLFVSYWFSIMYWKDLNRLRIGGSVHLWFKTALTFNAISSFGPYALAFMLATKNIQPDNYLASVYFFLHFQYNGWFFFACMGLWTHYLLQVGIKEMELKGVYVLFALACVPAYFLSALWLPVPVWLYWFTVLAVILQLTGWWRLLWIIRKYLPSVQKNMDPLSRVLFFLCAIALTAKLLLQSGSVIPSLSKLAFGFRPIVIGYLHLVLLGVITLFIISYVVSQSLIGITKRVKQGIVIFTAGIIINEVLLLIQGIADLYYFPIPVINILLLCTALALFAGMLLINVRGK